MRFKELQQKNPEELKKILAESELELMKGNAQVAVGTIPKNPGQLRVLKKTIAKIRYLLSTKNNG